MVFLLVTGLVSGVVIFLVASLLGWMTNKVAPNLGHVATTVAVVTVATAAVVYVMTRPAIVGPYEQWTFENIGGQILGGVFAMGLKLWIGKTAESEQTAT